jgi:hypothetical protein
VHPTQLDLFSHAAHIPLFLYPFLNTVTKTKAFEYLRLTSLGVIGALVKVSSSRIASRFHLRSLIFFLFFLGGDSGVRHSTLFGSIYLFIGYCVLVG